MRYNLGCMDKYPIEAAGSAIENTPLYKVVFNDYIDPIRLEEAIRKAFKSYPLFQTSVEFDSEYYLRTNTKPLVILNCKEEDRPHTFGKNTNNYPWRICYYQKELCFEWLHGITDGNGALQFLKQIILSYFEYELEKKSINYLVAPGLEPFFDTKEKGINYEVDPQGFKIKYLKKIKKRGYKSDCHKLIGSTKEIVDLAKICRSSVTPVLAILYSQALRLHLSKKAKNRNVACNIVLDVRRILNYETMHNCIDIKRLTYVDSYDNMSFTSVAKIYKDKLDKARVSQNLIREITDRVSTFNLVHKLPTKWLLKLCYKIGGPLFKDDDCNFTISYPGKIELPKEIINKINYMELKVWHDVGESVISAVDYNGKFIINITESFADKGIVDDFIKLANGVGLHYEKVEDSIFEQSHFDE